MDEQIPDAVERVGEHRSLAASLARAHAFEGVKFVTELPDNEPCVGIATLRDRVFVATTQRVYELIDSTLVPLRWQMPEVQG